MSILTKLRDADWTAVLVAVVSLAAISGITVAVRNEAREPSVDAAMPAFNVEMYRQGVETYVDYSGCEYLVVRAVGITPRLNRNGKPVCTEANRIAKGVSK